MLNGDVCQTAPSRPREGAFLFGRDLGFKDTAPHLPIFDKVRTQ